MTSATVTVYRNGDPTFAGKKMVVNKKQIRTLDAFLDKVTKDTRMCTAARRIKTPTGRHTITKLESLESGGSYVAQGPEAFKRLPYTEIKVLSKSTPRKEEEIHPVIHNPRLQMSGRARKVAATEPLNNKSIHVFCNGDELKPSHRMLLDKRDLSSMDTVLKLVTNKVHLQSGAVFWLFTLDGKEIEDPTQLENGGQYVAVGHGKMFKKLAYKDQGSNLSPRSRVPTKTQFKVARKNKSSRTKNETSKASYRKTSTTSNSQRSSSQSAHDDQQVRKESLWQGVQEKIQENFLEENPTQPPPERSPTPKERVYQASGESKEKAREVQDDQGIKNKLITNAGESVRQEVQEIFQEKFQEEYISQPPPERSPTPKERVYQASGENKEKAREVQDDNEVKEDKPIDQMLAEEVEEEIFDKGNDNEVTKDKNDEEDDKNKENKNVEKENSGFGGFIEDLIDDVREKFDDDDDEEEKRKEEKKKEEKNRDK